MIRLTVKPRAQIQPVSRTVWPSNGRPLVHLKYTTSCLNVGLLTSTLDPLLEKLRLFYTLELQMLAVQQAKLRRKTLRLQFMRSTFTFFSLLHLFSRPSRLLTTCDHNPLDRSICAKTCHFLASLVSHLLSHFFSLIHIWPLPKLHLPFLSWIECCFSLCM